MTTFTVTNTNDSGAGSLRQAIEDSNLDAGQLNTIEFDPSLAGQTITLLSPLPFSANADIITDINLNVTGTNGGDNITTFGGDDLIDTLSGFDTVDAGAGDDTIIFDETTTGFIMGGDGFDIAQNSTDTFLNFGFNNTATSPEARFFTADGGMLDIAAERIELFDSVGNLSRLLLLGDITGDTIDASTESAFNGVSILGGGGDDLIIVDENGMGAIDGGDGFDTVQLTGTIFSTSSSAEGFFTNIEVGMPGNNFSINDIERVEIFDPSTSNLSRIFLNGTTGADTITTIGEPASLFVGNINSGAGDDIITLRDGSFHFVFAGDGNDTITGGNFTDQIIGGAGADIIDGGGGIDRASYSLSSEGVNVNLLTNVNTGGDAEGDDLSNIEDIIGSFFGDDVLVGDTGSNELRGLSGDDTLIGGQGADSLSGGTGSDIFQIEFLSEANGDTIQDFDTDDSIVFTAEATFVGASAFSASGGAEIRAIETGGTTLVQYDADGNGTSDGTLTIANGEFELSDINAGSAVTLAVDDTITGTSGDDTLTGTVNDDVINGLGGDDIITTLTGNDIVDAGSGADTIILSQDGSGTIDGGTGQDLVQIETGFLSQSAVNQDTIPEITLFTNVGTYDLSRVERIEGLDSATGELNNLILVGNNGVNNFDLTSETGNFSSTIYAGGSEDTVTANANANGSFLEVFLGSGNDTFNGGDGTSFIRTGLGADTINGGSGFEIVFYEDSAEAVNINLDTGIFTGGTAEGDVLTNIERIFGSNFDDVLIGSSGNDTFFGGDGDDIVNTGGGDDLLFSSNGNMVFTGGSGADDFNIFSLFGNNFDGEITDLEIEDTISVTESSFIPVFIGSSGFTNTLGEIRYEYDNGQTILQLDDTGDGLADHFLTISNGEFNLIDSNNFSNSFQIVIDAPIFTEKNDTFIGTSADEILDTLGGNDIIDAGAGDDTVNGGTGNDNLRGEAGNDTLNGDGNNDIIDGGNGDDIIDGGTGADTLRGGGNNDVIDGGTGADSISAGIGDDTANGGDGNDSILGQGGADTLFGDAGMDMLRGGSGNDTLFGGDDRDLLFGQGNNDILFGEGGNDTLSLWRDWGRYAARLYWRRPS